MWLKYGKFMNDEIEGKNYKKLFKIVTSNSKAKIWNEAVKEWDIDKKYDNGIADDSCTCSHENIRYVFIIKNINTDRNLKIGSTCISKFGRKELDEYASVSEQEFKLFSAVREKKFITLDNNFFTRKLIKLFRDKKVITEKDYSFMLKMFNKKNKEDITKNQQKYINGLLGFTIYPYLEKELASQIVIKQENNATTEVDS